MHVHPYTYESMYTHAYADTWWHGACACACLHLGMQVCVTMHAFMCICGACAQVQVHVYMHAYMLHGKMITWPYDGIAQSSDGQIAGW